MYVQIPPFSSHCLSVTHLNKLSVTNIQSWPPWPLVANKVFSVLWGLGFLTFFFSAPPLRKTLYLSRIRTFFSKFVLSCFPAFLMNGMLRNHTCHQKMLFRGMALLLNSHILFILWPDPFIMMFPRTKSVFMELKGCQVTRYFKENSISKESSSFASKKVGTIFNKLHDWSGCLLTVTIKEIGGNQWYR